MQGITELIIAAQQGDDAAIGKLYETSYGKGIAIARQHVRTEEDAEDVFQEAFLKALTHIDSFDTSKEFFPWLDTIIVNTAKNLVARKDNSAVTNFTAINSVGNPDGDESDKTFENQIKSTDTYTIPEEAIDMNALRDIMEEILNELPEVQREAMVLRFYKEMSLSEIAQIQGVPEEAVKSRLRYSKAKVRDKVNEYEKQNNIKLHSIGALPLFVLFMFSGKGRALAAQILNNAGPVGSAAATSAAEVAKDTGTSVGSSAAKAAGTTVGSTAAKAGGLALSAKIAITAAVSVCVIGIIAGVVIYSQQSDDDHSAQINNPEKTSTEVDTSNTETEETEESEEVKLSNALNAYADFLSDKVGEVKTLHQEYRDYTYTETEFDLIYLNDDDIPELVVCTKNEPWSFPINIYTYEDGVLKRLDENYEEDADVLYYWERCSLIAKWDERPTDKDLYTLYDTESQSFACTIADGYPDYTYLVNGTETTKEELDKYYVELTENGKCFAAGSNYCTSENVNTLRTEDWQTLLISY